MGRDKCLLMVKGQSLWRRQWATLNALSSELAVVAPQRPVWCAPEMPWIEDEGENSGPLAGLAAALQASSQNLVAVLAVDLPAMTSDYLEQLLSASTSICGAVPEFDGVFQPLSAVYPRVALPLVRAHLGGEGKSLQDLVRRLLQEKMIRALPVEPSQRILFQNWNRPEDCGPLL